MIVYQRFLSTVLLFTLASLSVMAQEGGAKPYVIRGLVVDGSGSPVGNALVCVGTVPTYFEREGTSFPRTDHEGKFRFETPYPPPFTMSVYHPDYLSVTKRISKAEGDAEASFTLSRGETLGGIVKADPATLASLWATVWFPNNGYEALTKEDEQGQPLRADLALHIVEDNKDGRFVATTDSDGRHAFHGLPTGTGQLRVSSPGKASRLVEVAIEASDQTHEVIALDRGVPVRCRFVNTPEGTEQVQLVLFFGKQSTPTGTLADIQYLLDQPVAQTRLTRSRKVSLEHVEPGAYTLLAYPVAPDYRNERAYRSADALLRIPVYMDTFTLREGADSITIAVAFPGETPRQVANKPTHPIVGQWVYQYKGSLWMRTFTRDGRCILTEGGVFVWENPYIILGTQRVAVIIGNSKHIHTVREDDRLDVEGKFVGTRVVR